MVRGPWSNPGADLRIRIFPALTGGVEKGEEKWSGLPFWEGLREFSWHSRPQGEKETSERSFSRTSITTGVKGLWERL